MLGNNGDDGEEEQPQAADEELVNPVADLAGQDADIQEEAESQRALRDPGSPSKADREEHDLTHLPYRPWCDACVRGRAKDKMSLRLTEAYSHSCVPRVRMDYCYLTEKTADEATGEADQDPGAGDSATVLVVQESVCRSVWAYAVERKGATEEWVCLLYTSPSPRDSR